MDKSIPITPQRSLDADPLFKNRLSCAIHVLDTEAAALSHLVNLYDIDPIARGGFNSAVGAIIRFNGDKDKLIISGVGKSGHIGKKIVATMNSLKIHATYLHPTEALHGDLGK
jgi:D-arabinose 5-phosphate isomerase GutQ